MWVRGGQIRGVRPGADPHRLGGSVKMKGSVLPLLRKFRSFSIDRPIAIFCSTPNLRYFPFFILFHILIYICFLNKYFFLFIFSIFFFFCILFSSILVLQTGHLHLFALWCLPGLDWTRRHRPSGYRPWTSWSSARFRPRVALLHCLVAQRRRIWHLRFRAVGIC